MATERIIHFSIFVLLLIGLCSLTAWICYAFIDNLILQIAGITLSWGTILLVFFVGFTRLEWDWWREEKQKEPETPKSV